MKHTVHHMTVDQPIVGMIVLVSHISIPHGTYNGEPVTEYEMTNEEISAYHQGYDDNEASGGKKVW